MLKRFPDGDISVIKPRGDALVLWRSGLAYSARDPVTQSAALSVRHWVFARADRPKVVSTTVEEITDSDSD